MCILNFLVNVFFSCWVRPFPQIQRLALFCAQMSAKVKRDSCSVSQFYFLTDFIFSIVKRRKESEGKIIILGNEVFPCEDSRSAKNHHML